MFFEKTKEHCTAFLLFVVVAIAFGGFLFGYYTGIIAGAIVFLAPSFHLTVPEEGVVVSMVLIGALIGALSAGMLADWLGRKKAIALTTALFIIGAGVAALSQSYAALLLGR